MKTLFVTDLDGTFVKDSISVNNKDLDGYLKLSKLGDFAIATGRSLKEIDYVVENNGIKINYAIALNGAVVRKEDNEIFSKNIDKNDSKNILTYIKENNLIFDCLDGESRIGNFIHEKKERLWNLEIVYSENPFELLFNKTIYKINIRPEEQVLDFYLDDMKKLFPNVSIYQTGSTRIEITAKNISKASAINLIKNNYEKVVVFGDSGNDIEMFNCADVSYCMSSAPEYVKLEAAYVVDSFFDAVNHYIELDKKNKS
ncbi:Cof-type HAD-IIB family hydrolase [Gemelliphila palaticanis]|nr:Cof-type HAD-IIB family hydrolase [Gemella palaticanis]